MSTASVSAAHRTLVWALFSAYTAAPKVNGVNLSSGYSVPYLTPPP